MKQDEARAIHVNDTVRDDEIEEIEQLCADAAPGVWRVRDGEVCRFNGDRVDDPASLRLMARAREVIPRLLRGVKVLEGEVRLQWAKVQGLEAERKRATVRHAADLERADTGTRCERSAGVLVKAIGLGIYGGNAAVSLLDRWARGEDLSHSLAPAVEDEKRRQHDRAIVRVEYRTSQRALWDDVVAVLETIDARKLTPSQRDAVKKVIQSHEIADLKRV